MRSLIIKTIAVCLLASAVALFCVQDTEKTAKATTTYWYKIPPNTCTINVTDDDLSIAKNLSTYGDLSLISTVYGDVEIVAYCPVNLPDGVVANLLRIRDFQTNGLPAYTGVTVQLRRRLWSGAGTTLASAYLDENGQTDDSVVFSSTISNENYQYLVQVTLSKDSNANDVPVLSMIEIRYEI